MNNLAVVTGGGSGVGRAVALALGKRGWTVAVVGRTLSRLETVASEIAAGARAFQCDVAQPAEVDATAQTIAKEMGTAQLLVNSAGINVPRRALAEVSVQDYRRILATNLDGAFYWSRALLPGMKHARQGTIVNIVSDAGLQANAKAGVGYCASKFGLAGLTQAINAEERANGIRAVGIFPGDINTPLLEKRAVVPSPQQRALMLQPDDVAACVLLAVELPPTAVVEQLLVRPR